MQTTLGILITTRGFFPTHLVKGAREQILNVCREMDVKAIVLSETEATQGAVENLEDAKKCAELFR